MTQQQNTFFVDNIDKLATDNEAYRKVLKTTTTQQLVLMSLLPGEEIGVETHPHTTQFIKVTQGECTAILDGQTFQMKEDFAVLIPAGTKHNITNTSKDKNLKLYTIYSPPEHPVDTLQQTKPLTHEQDGGSLIQSKTLYENARSDYVSLRHM
jgi:mannose-6-phosphate isomerase-like protein (cupin superfamily)